MSPIVFISYSAKDEVLASAIHAFLNSTGIKALKAPDDIAPGTNWAAAIAEMIEGCTHMVLVWTSNSMASQEVSKELTLAMQCGAVIIPFRSEDLAPEGAWRYHLSQVQWLEAHAMPEGQALETLLRQVGVGSSVSVATAQPPDSVATLSTATPPASVPRSTPQELSQADRSAIRTKKLTASFLALFLGGFGAHKFFLGRTIQGCIYLGLFVMTLVIAGTFGSAPEDPANDADGVVGLLILFLSGMALAEAITYFKRSVEDFERINIRGKRPWF
jgi:TM2 domain-containing membrane protein YozV